MGNMELFSFMDRWAIWSFSLSPPKNFLTGKLLVPLCAVQITIIIVPGFVEVGTDKAVICTIYSESLVFWANISLKKITIEEDCNTFPLRL